MYLLNKLVLGLLILLFITGCADNYINEYDLTDQKINEVNTQPNLNISENVPDEKVGETIENNEVMIGYEGEWHRTDVASYQWANMIISDWKEGESFKVTILANYADYGGPLEGIAVFIKEDVAVLYDENAEEFLKNQEEDHGVYIQFLENSINITHDNCVQMYFGGGGIVTAEGTYIQGDPAYTNCADVDEIFTDRELELIQDLLGESYDVLFKNMIELGEMKEYEMDNGRFWEVYKPPYGAEWCNILIYQDGRIYIEGCSYLGTKEFYTNSGDAEMPDIELLGNVGDNGYSGNLYITERNG